MKNLLKKIIYKFFCICPIKKNKIVLCNFYNKDFGDNPKYIAEYLRNNKKNKYDLVWIINDPLNNNVPKQIRTVSKGLNVLYEYATAKVWISNVRLPLYLKKRKKQFYIQTWHGGLGLKKVELDVKDTLTPTYVKMIKHDNEMINLALSNSTFLTNLYRKSMGYQGEILEKGLPRNDNLINSYQNSNKIKNKFNIKDEKVLLYAPTFRDNYRTNAYNIDFNKVIKILEKNKEKWKILVKFHPNINNANEIVKFNNKIINCSNYGDINELYLISDILITDYSSCMFDFMLTGKKIILYAPDIKEYKKERNFGIKIGDLPFLKSETTEELYKLLKNNKHNDQKEYDLIKNKYGLNETGKSTEEISKIIENVIGG